MKKTFAIVSILFLFGCGFALASNATGEITTSQTFYFSPGEAISSDFTIEDIQVSPTLGGLISTISKYVERFVDFNGLRIFKDSSTTSPEFTLMAFPVGSVLGENIVVGEVFELSESVILENRTEIENIWITYYVDASWGDDVDAQGLGNLNEWLGSNCGSIMVTGLTSTTASYDLTGYPDMSSPITSCDGRSICPSEFELQSVFGLIKGINYDAINTFNNPYGFAGEVVVLTLDGNLVGLLIDKNCDHSMDLIENIVFGYSTESWEKNVLLLAPPGVYDIYTIF